jgi:hypothetical protein
MILAVVWPQVLAGDVHFNYSNLGIGVNAALAFPSLKEPPSKRTHYPATLRNTLGVRTCFCLEATDRRWKVPLKLGINGRNGKEKGGA